MDELIRNATIDDLKRGYIWSSKDGNFICLFCSKDISNNGDYADKHVKEHGEALERLLLLDKKYNGLTEIQKELLSMISNKYSNKEIAINLGCTESTVRNMKFSLRERAKQARVFLAAMDLAEEGKPVISQNKLRSFPIKESKRKALLPRFANLFEPNREYSEKEVKVIIKNIYEDDAMIRRYLVDYGYLKRSNDGSKYYRNNEVLEMKKIDRKELINEYKQKEVELGIIKIENKITGYSFVDVCNNLYKPFEGIKFQLNLGRFKSKGLQKDWKEYGEAAFSFEIVEKLKTKAEETEKEKLENLSELLDIWVESQGKNIKLY